MENCVFSDEGYSACIFSEDEEGQSIFTEIFFSSSYVPQVRTPGIVVGSCVCLQT